MKAEKRDGRALRATPAAAEKAPAADRGRAFLACALAWALPGAGHLWLGRTQKGVVFLVTLPLLFLMGLNLQGRLFPFEPAEPLVALAALASLGVGMIYFVTSALGYGSGQVVAATYEYGNTFIIVAGLLNLLVVIDAYDVAVGRK